MALASPAGPSPTGDRLLLVLVGLPARGKSYMANKLTSFLRWRGIAAESFNVGAARRKAETQARETSSASFFAADNAAATAMREQLAMDVLHSALEWLARGPAGSVAILDATNTTRARRLHLLEAIAAWTAGRSPSSPRGELRRRGSGETYPHHHACACCGGGPAASGDGGPSPCPPALTLPYVVFLELICSQPDVVRSNMLQKVMNSPDYRGCPVETALADLTARIASYEQVYQTLDEAVEDATSPIGPLSYIKLEDLQSKVVSRRVFGHVAYTILSFLVVVHIGQRPIWLVRAGQCTDDVVRAMIEGSMAAEAAAASAATAAAAAASVAAPARDPAAASAAPLLLSPRQQHAMEVAAHRIRDRRGRSEELLALAAVPPPTPFGPAAGARSQLQQRHSGGFSGAGVLHLYKGLASLSSQMATTALSAGLTLNDSGASFARMLAGFVLRRTAGGALRPPPALRAARAGDAAAAGTTAGGALQTASALHFAHRAGCPRAAAPAGDATATLPSPWTSAVHGGDAAVRGTGDETGATSHGGSTSDGSGSSAGGAVAAAVAAAAAATGVPPVRSLGDLTLVSTTTVPPPVHVAPHIASHSHPAFAAGPVEAPALAAPLVSMAPAHAAPPASPTSARGQPPATSTTDLRVLATRNALGTIIRSSSESAAASSSSSSSSLSSSSSAAAVSAPAIGELPSRLVAAELECDSPAAGDGFEDPNSGGALSSPSATPVASALSLAASAGSAAGLSIRLEAAPGPHAFRSPPASPSARHEHPDRGGSIGAMSHDLRARNAALPHHHHHHHHHQPDSARSESAELYSPALPVLGASLGGVGRYAPLSPEQQQTASPRATPMTRAGSSLYGSTSGHPSDVPLLLPAPPTHAPQLGHSRSITHVSALDVLRPIRVAVEDPTGSTAAGAAAASAAAAVAAVAAQQLQLQLHPRAAGGLGGRGAQPVSTAADGAPGGSSSAGSSGGSNGKGGDALQATLLPGSPGHLKSPGVFRRKRVRRRQSATGPAAVGGEGAAGPNDEGAPLGVGGAQTSRSSTDDDDDGDDDDGVGAFPSRSSGGDAPAHDDVADVDEDAEEGIVASAASVSQNEHYRRSFAAAAATTGTTREAGAPLTSPQLAASHALSSSSSLSSAPSARAAAAAPVDVGGVAPSSTPTAPPSGAPPPHVTTARAGGARAAPEVSPTAESELLVFDQAPAVFTSTLPRTIQTVAQLPFASQQLSSLNPMETGICLGVPLQYLDAQFPDEYQRWATAPNRATHRITGGESLMDVVQRLAPFVIEMERCRRPVLVCSHLSTLQLLLAYFKDVPVEDAPSIALPMNTVVEFTPHQYGWLERRYAFTRAGGTDESITSTVHPAAGAGAAAAGGPGPSPGGASVS